MGLTERHWFENEEPELTERQLEDAVYENKKAHERGYQKGYSDRDNVSFNQQGWQCPVCGAIYSPMTLACFNCTGWKVSNRNDTKTGDAIFDWTINESVTKTEKPKEGR